MEWHNLWILYTRRGNIHTHIFSKENKQNKIPGIYGRLRGNDPGSSFHYRSSNLSKNKDERGCLTLAYTHMQIHVCKCERNWGNKYVVNNIKGKDEEKKGSVYLKTRGQLKCKVKKLIEFSWTHKYLNLNS